MAFNNFPMNDMWRNFEGNLPDFSRFFGGQNQPQQGVSPVPPLPTQSQVPPTMSGLPQHQGPFQGPWSDDPTQGGRFNPMPTPVPTGMQHLQPSLTGYDPSQQYGAMMPQVPGWGQSEQYGAMMPTMPGAQSMQSQYGGMQGMQGNNQGAPIAGSDFLRQLLGG